MIVKLRPDVVSVMDSDANGLRFAGQVGLTNAAVYSILDGTDVHEKAKQVSQLPGALPKRAAWTRHGCLQALTKVLEPACRAASRPPSFVAWVSARCPFAAGLDCYFENANLCFLYCMFLVCSCGVC